MWEDLQAVKHLRDKLLEYELLQERAQTYSSVWFWYTLSVAHDEDSKDVWTTKLSQQSLNGRLCNFLNGYYSKVSFHCYV